MSPSLGYLRRVAGSPALAARQWVSIAHSSEPSDLLVRRSFVEAGDAIVAVDDVRRLIGVSRIGKACIAIDQTSRDHARFDADGEESGR